MTLSKVEFRCSCSGELIDAASSNSEHANMEVADCSTIAPSDRKVIVFAVPNYRHTRVQIFEICVKKLEAILLKDECSSAIS